MMTKEEIIEMVQRCGLFGIRPYPDGTYSEALEDFAKLIAKKEREDCIKIVMQGTGEPVQRKTLDILHQERTRIALAIKGQE